ncbi:hypothetical protein [Streptomyces ossamyceticus]|uniref:hypothetical protein n=1 Tax=Streptomyces ossamyceticus TaxID=249581 RepID=UPI000B2EFCA7|nr:hypothetical protein [Streptomyces ossamyceticus]
MVKDTEVLPLTWAQEAWMAGPPRLGVDDVWRHDVSVPLELPANTTPDDIEAAMGRVIARFPTLRARFTRTATGGLAQDIVPRREVAQRPFAPNVVVRLPRPGRSRAAVTVAVPHAFVDIAGAAALVGAIREEVLCPGERPEQQDLRRIVAFERSERAARQSARGIAHLVTTARMADSLGLEASSPYAELLKGHGLRCDGRWLSQVLWSRWPGSRVTRAAVMLSLNLIALRRTFDSPKSWLAIRTANRSSDEDLSFVGLTTRYGWLVEGADPSLDFRNMVRRSASALMESSLLTRFDPRRADEELTTADLTRYPAFYFNYWEDPGARRPGPPGSGAASPGELDAASGERLVMPLGVWHFEVNYYAADDLSTLIVKYDGDRFTEGHAQQLVSFLREAAVLLHKNPRVTVAELLDLP